VLYAGIGSSCVAHGINSWAISHVSGILPTVYSGVQVTCPGSTEGLPYTSQIPSYKPYSTSVFP
jgi:hypothetical protein